LRAVAEQATAAADQPLVPQLWPVYDEGAAVLACCATRRVARLGPAAFAAALELAALEPPEATIENERQRVVRIVGWITNQFASLPAYYFSSESKRTLVLRKRDHRIC
jgi:hypothetical protein